MALSQTPRISIKYPITIKGERDKEERGRETNGKERIRSMYLCDSIKNRISHFLILRTR